MALRQKGRAELPMRLRSKVRVIYQSVEPTRAPPAKKHRFFEVCVLGHLRHEKDPFRPAWALRLVPAESRIHQNLHDWTGKVEWQAVHGGSEREKPRSLSELAAAS